MTSPGRLVSVTEARRRWGTLVSMVRQGEAVVLTRRGEPIAVLEGAAAYVARRIAAGDDAVLSMAPALEFLWRHAVEALGDEARARHWLVARRGSLAGRTPLEVALTEGPDRIHQLLGAIEHGNVL